MSGLDWIMENEADVVEVADLVYAKNTSNPIRLVIAVSNDSNINTIYDLKGKRIATELVRVTQNYLKRNGVEAYVEYSYGATEVKVPHLVDAIADITETGSSLKANNLREIATVLQSTTKLHANKGAWQDPWKREKLQTFRSFCRGAPGGQSGPENERAAGETANFWMCCGHETANGRSTGSERLAGRGNNSGRKAGEGTDSPVEKGRRPGHYRIPLNKSNPVNKLAGPVK